MKNLYILVGNIVIGGVALSTAIESSKDDTKLWHVRLGHIGEHGMLEFRKKKYMLKGVR